ncbi:transposase family protein [Kitasatospora sp. NPDC101155]|uniref:transposase family protein n=1 Tax=Kitasatospora sp. NPDC101155 TaxID=3364097 RepID=UPI00382124CB
MGDQAPELLKVLFPHLDQVLVDRIVRVGRSVRIVARCVAPTAWCPGCGTASSRGHSRYRRRLADTAVGGQTTAIDLTVRRFFCDTAECPKRTFAEQVDQLTFRHGRRTMSL